MPTKRAVSERQVLVNALDSRVRAGTNLFDFATLQELGDCSDRCFTSNHFRVPFRRGIRKCMDTQRLEEPSQEAEIPVLFALNPI